MKKFLQAQIMEFLGAFIMQFVALTQNPADLGALSQLMCLTFLTWGGKEISGAHFNPVVTIAMILAQKTEIGIAIFYFASQGVGALLATFIHMLMTKMNGDSNEDWSKFAPRIPEASMILRPLICEAICSFVFVFCFMAFMVDKKAPKAIFGFGVGCAYAMGVLTLAPLTGGCMNPFKWLAAAIFNPKLFAFIL
jgi:glycerol uptake facilitator-like aquaporin